MIPPSPMQFTLWGSALYTELATGLWRALAAPWLPPGWPAAACAADRSTVHAPGPVARPAAAAGPAAGEQRLAASAGASGPAPALEPRERRVIEVPRGRWQHRRPPGGTSPREG